ncbi:MAG TPA: imelysin family protein [Burkholderiales bacterium]|nr:imelysin family protein [Burkholderiales bacterium]
MLKRYGWIAVLVLGLSACTSQTTSPATVLEQYGKLVHASYQDSLNAARELQQAIERFIAAPSQEGLDEARKQWLAAREWYGQTEAFRFYGGPIDAEDGPEGRINAWPLDEAYVDAVKGRADSGIVNNPKITIDKKTLAELNEKDGEENIATGWHAVEFLLWGQDANDNGPGNRAYTDFVDGKSKNAARRRLYLKTVAELLVEDLESVTKTWAPGEKNYRAEFVADPANIGKMLTGIGVLTRGELAGERIEVALDTKSQEDEHSCFADNTHRDIVTNVQGIRNVWRGEYKTRDGATLSGPSLRGLVAAKDQAAAQRVDADMDASLKLAESIAPPFDRAIRAGAPERKAVEETVAALKRQAEGLVGAAEALGIKRLNTSLPK